MTNQKESGNRTAQQNRHREGSEKEIVLVRQLLLTDVVQRSQRGKGPPRSHPGTFPPKQNKLPLCRRSYFFASQHHAESLGLTKTELTRKKYLELTDTAAMRSWERFSSSVGIQDQSSYLDLMVSFLQNVNIGLSCHLERRSCRNGSSPSSRQLPSVGRYGWNLLGS